MAPEVPPPPLAPAPGPVWQRCITSPSSKASTRPGSDTGENKMQQHMEDSEFDSSHLKGGQSDKKKTTRLRASGWNIRDRTNKGHLVVGVYYRSPDQGALVSPQLRYCLYVWCPQHRKDMELLKRVQMRTTKNGQRAGTPLLLWR